ncbi:MAG: ABC transporter permease [Epsilonproteobacteria bacterium]|nr:ABC transporter permease [Campylobacterota bacterium]
MVKDNIVITQHKDGCQIELLGEIDIHSLDKIEKKLTNNSCKNILAINIAHLKRIDTAAALFIKEISHDFKLLSGTVDEKIQKTLDLVKDFQKQSDLKQEISFLESIGKFWCKKVVFLSYFFNFIGELVTKKVSMLFSWKNFRYKEILFEINQSAIKAVGIVALTSFLVGIVIAYQSAVQLKMYGANIFIVDMLGISILRELAPMITAIVIAGRSGSAYTAEIGAMKITEELDAMRTMGFDPYYYLVIPRIIALSISLPLLIFIADIAGVFGGMIIAHTELDISPGLFLERFASVVDVKHFLIGEFKGPFFASMIAMIAIYRGFMVKDDTQSIGKNTTKSVVESIFSVIVIDAVFSIIFTKLGL